MSEYEKFTPAENQEHSALTPPEAAPRNEAHEAKLNPRVEALMTARDEAERKLQEAILDVETREQSPAFQKATELFKDGNRLVLKMIEDGEVASLDLFKHDNGNITAKNYDYKGEEWEQRHMVPYLDEEDVSHDLGLPKDSMETIQHLLNLSQERA